MKKYLSFFLFTLNFTLSVYFLKAQQPRLMLPIGHTMKINSVSFSPDGQLMLTISGDSGITKIWNAISGKLVANLTGHTGWVNNATFSPDGRFVVTASRDSTARIWYAADGQLLGDLRGHTDEVYAAVFSPDGRSVLTASDDQIVKIWNAAREKAEQIKQIEKLNERTGLYILSASARNQAAYEFPRLNHGLLTYSLLEAIKHHPDILEGGRFLNIGRWFSTAADIVTDICKEFANLRQNPQIQTNTDFNIGIVDTEVLAKIVLPEFELFFEESSFLNLANSDDNLGLSRLVNEKLSDISGSREKRVHLLDMSGINYPDAFNLRGGYEIKNDVIQVKAYLKRGSITKTTFEISGNTNHLEALANELVEKAINWLH